MAIHHMAVKKMYNLFLKYKSVSLIAFLLLVPASFALAVNYGSGIYNSGFYSSTPPGAPMASVTPGTYNVSQSVTLTAASSTSIKYATDVMPTDCSSGTTYTTAISVSTSTTIYARACNVYGNSTTASFAYIIDTVPPATPTANPVAGVYNQAKSVALDSSGSDYIKYSTTQIPADCASGITYAGPIDVLNSQTIYVRACDNAGNSSVTSFAYTIDTTTPLTPVASPISGPYNSTQLVSLSATDSTSIRYSTASVPASCSAGSLYVSPISVSSSQTIYVRACSLAGNYSTSSFAYIIDTVPPETPTVSTPAGSYNGTQSVSLDSVGSTYIKYSTSQLPANCSSGTTYAGPISVSSSQTIYVRACDDADNSSTATFSYIIDSAAPIISQISAATSTISWTTNKLASSIVDYGLTNSYGSSTPETDISPRVTSHSVSISNLASCTTYHYRVRSKDVVTNEGISPDQVFTTNGCVASSAHTENVSSQIDKTVGGSIAVSDNSIKLDIPTSFASSSANFQIHKLDKTTVINQVSVPSGYLSASTNVFELKSLTNNSTIISSFSAPLTVTMSYTASDIVGINEATLKIYRYDGSSWNQLNNCSTNTSAKTVTCETSNFSVFSIFGQAATTTTTTTTTSGNNAPASLSKPVTPVGGFIVSSLTTNTRSVTLKFNAGSDVNRIAISSTKDFKNASLEKYNNTKQIDICGKSAVCANGNYIVYVKLYTPSGVSSEVITVNINYQPEVVSQNTNTTTVVDKVLSNKLKGKILLQTESHGEAWYVNPKDAKKYYLADGNKAYEIMRTLGIGISTKDLNRIKANTNFAKKHSGKIFLQVESRGEAYYIDFKGVSHYLKDGVAAYEIMRTLGLGVTNSNLSKIAE